jgi:molecular chaperone HscB
MTSDPIPVRLERIRPAESPASDATVPSGEAVLECRTCGAGAPVDEHFCPHCSRVLALGRHGDYFSFLGLPRKLTLDLAELETKFRDLSRQLHPDYFYNASPSERLASLERSSYLNDAFRTLRNPASRAEYLLIVEGHPLSRPGADAPKPPAGMLAEVFALNEELDEIREARQAGEPGEALRARLDVARQPIDARRMQHERAVAALSERIDGLAADAPEREGVLEALREQLLERNYINNLLATIEREASALTSGAGTTLEATLKAESRG